MRLVFDTIVDLLRAPDAPLWPWFTLVPAALAALGLLFYVTIKPLVSRYQRKEHLLHEQAIELKTSDVQPHRHIVVAIDFSLTDQVVISHALKQGGKESLYTLIHVVESAGALVYGKEITDFESVQDHRSLESYAATIRSMGYRCEIRVAYGRPQKAIPEAVNGSDATLLVMGAHGHNLFKDLIFGETVNTVRHRVRIPVLIVR
jgi:manganese transport protein